MPRHPNAAAPVPERRVRPAVSIAALFLGIFVLNLPPAAAQTSSDSTALLTWTAPGDDGNVGRATSYDLRHRTVGITGTDTTSWWNAATQVSGEPVPSAAGSTDSMRVRGLTPLTTYYFMIRAADEVPNWSGFSNVAVHTTSGDATAPAAITTLAITASTASTFSLRWTATGDDNNTGTAASYDIRYSTSPITSSNFASATQATGEPAPQAAGTVQTFTLSGLQSGQTYYVAMKVADERNNISGLSNVVSGTTTDTTPPAAVRDLSDAGVGSWTDDPLAFLGQPVAEGEGRAL